MTRIKTKTKRSKKRTRESNLFYALLMLFPTVQFILFYVVVNFKSFGYAFMQQEKISDTEIIWKFTFDNIAQWFANPSKLSTLWSTTKMSLLYYALSLCVSVPLGLLFSYYIFKKLPASKFFRVFLFLPSIIPAAALVLSYKLILNEASPVLLGSDALRFDTNQFGAVVFYNLFISFGASVLMYANKMSDISPEIIDAGKIDGAVGFREFWHIVLPLAYPTISVFLITGIATIFTSQYNLFLFNANPELRSLGFYLYDLTNTTIGHEQDIPNVAALGLILTAVAIPLTFFFRWILEKFGPSEE